MTTNYPTTGDPNRQDIEQKAQTLKALEEQLAKIPGDTKGIRGINRKIRQLKEAMVEKALAVLATSFIDLATDKGEVSKRLAFIANNRPIDMGHVKTWMEVIRRGEYLDHLPLTGVVDVADFHVKHPEIEIRDADRNTISEPDLKDFVLIIDGQHRIMAFALLISMGQYEEPVPNVVDVPDISNVAHYLRTINYGKSWSNLDKGFVIAETAPERYKPYCRFISKMQHMGMSRSTASEIPVGKPITAKQVDMLLNGKEPKTSIDFNIDKAQKFVDGCLAAGITIKYLSKRYFIEGYEAFARCTSDNTAEKALSRLGMLTEAELKSVTSKDVFKTILSNVNITDQPQ